MCYADRYRCRTGCGTMIRTTCGFICGTRDTHRYRVMVRRFIPIPHVHPDIIEVETVVVDLTTNMHPDEGRNMSGSDTVVVNEIELCDGCRPTVPPPNPLRRRT